MRVFLLELFSGDWAATFGAEGSGISLALLLVANCGHIPIRWCFDITLFLAGAFGLAAGGSPNLVTLASLLAVMGVGVGGNRSPGCLSRSRN